MLSTIGTACNSYDSAVFNNDLRAIQFPKRKSSIDRFLVILAVGAVLSRAVR